MTDTPIPDTTPHADAVLFGMRALISLRDDVVRLDHALAFVDDSGGEALCDAASITERVEQIADLALAVRCDAERLRGILVPMKSKLSEATIDHIGQAVLVLGNGGHHVAAETFSLIARAGVFACGADDRHVGELSDAIVRLAGHGERRTDDEARDQAEAVADLVARTVIDYMLDQPDALKFGAGDLKQRMKSLLGRPATLAGIVHVLKGGTA